MSLRTIPSQPVLLTPTVNTVDDPHFDVQGEFCGDCTDEPLYCLKIANNDGTTFQMYNEPDLLDFLGNDCELYEIIYEMSLKEDWTAEDTWTNDGAPGDPWVYTPGGAPGSLQLTSGFTPVIGQWYLINYQVTINNAEIIQVYWGAVLIGGAGGAAGQYSGSIMHYATNAVDLPIFTPDTTLFDGQLDSMVISEIAPGWQIVNWQPQEDGCGFCIVDPEASSTFILPGILTSGTGATYYISFEIRNRENGAVGIASTPNDINPVSTLIASENGFYGLYFNVESGNTQIKIDALDGFDGCIYNIKLYSQCRNHRLLLVDGAQTTVLADLSYRLRYDYNWMTLEPTDLSSIYALTQGQCYKLIVISDCYSQEQSLITFGDWVMGANSSVDVDTGFITMNGLGDPASINYDYSVDDIDCEHCFILNINISEHDGLPGALSVYLAGVLVVDSLEVLESGIVSINLNTEETAMPCPINSGDKIEIYYRDSEITISEIVLVYDPACQNFNSVTGDFVSNCIQYLGAETNNPCMSLIIAGMDNQPVYVPVASVSFQLREAFGFLWGVGFRMSFREKLVFHNSHHVGTSSNYKYNNGLNKRTAAQTERRWDVAVGHCDENLHDSIAMMLKLDWMLFTKTYTYAPYKQELYIGTENDYQPNWSKDAKTVTADGKFEVARKRRSTKFSNNII